MMYIIKLERTGKYLRDISLMSWTDERDLAAAIDLFFSEEGQYMDLPELLETLVHYHGPVVIEKK